MKSSNTRLSANAFCEGAAPIAYFCEGRHLGGSLASEWIALSPAQHLIVGVAGGFASTCRQVALNYRFGKIDLEVVVTAEESSKFGNRLSNVAVTAVFLGGITAKNCQKIMAVARPICTAANTIWNASAIGYQSRVVSNGSRTRPPRLSRYQNDVKDN